jgi:hypothetical protein
MAGNIWAESQFDAAELRGPNGALGLTTVVR